MSDDPLDFLTPQELALYYPGLLILEYIGKPKAFATIGVLATPVTMPQTTEVRMTFSAVPTSGHFDLYYADSLIGTIQWNDSSITLEALIRANGTYNLSQVFVTGLFAGRYFDIYFIGVQPPAHLMSVKNNTLLAGATAVTIAFPEIDRPLPLAVENGFDITPQASTISKPGNTAVGVQLDIIGKYAGVTRTGPGFTANITLNDADFLSLIRMAILVNYAGSSLYDIQNLIYTFFSGLILVFDYQNMALSYVISQSVGSYELVQRFIVGGLLPKPMAVQVSSIIYIPVVTGVFGFRTYTLPGYNVSPFNSYSSYNTNWPWLSYTNAIIY